MKVMLLAAGKGERMRPLTLATPKPLLEVHGKALIVHHIERLAAAGLRELVINVSWLGEQIEMQCGNGEAWGVSIRYSREDEPLETAGGIIRARPLLGGEPFMVVNADIFTSFPFGELAVKARELQVGQGHLVLVDNPPHHTGGDFSLEGGQVLRPSGSTLTFAGIGLYHPAFFDGLDDGSRPLKPLLLRAMDGAGLYGEHFRGTWTDVGTPERLARLNEEPGSQASAP